MSLPNGWKKVKLGDVAKVTSGGTPLRTQTEYWNGDIPWVKTAQIQNRHISKDQVDEYITELGVKESSAKIVPKGTLLMAMYGQGKTRGQVAILDIDATINQACAAFNLKENEVSTQYLFQYFLFNYDNIRNLSNDGGQKNLSAEIIKKIPLDLPPLEEQKKIAATLSVWDSAIEKMEKLIEVKLHDFNLLMEKLIVKQSIKNKVKTYSIKELFDVVNRKNKTGNTNVLTSSAQYGLVNQQEYYKKNIASSDISGYYLLEKGDFAYNRSSSAGYPYGVIKRLEKYESGVLSTLYLCMTLKDEYKSFSDYFVFLFESGYLNNQLALICREGARNHGLLNVSKEDFFNMKVQLPSEKEQQNIVCILQNHSCELSLLKQQLENYKKQKQGLMQKLLTGQWRVK